VNSTGSAALSEFALQQLFMTLVIGDGVSPKVRAVRAYLPDAPEAVVAAVREGYCDLGFPKSLCRHYSLYGGPDVVVGVSDGYCEEDGRWINVAGWGEAALVRALAATPAEWVRCEPDREPPPKLDFVPQAA